MSRCIGPRRCHHLDVDCHGVKHWTVKFQPESKSAHGDRPKSRHNLPSTAALWLNNVAIPECAFASVKKLHRSLLIIFMLSAVRQIVKSPPHRLQTRLPLHSNSQLLPPRAHKLHSRFQDDIKQCRDLFVMDRVILMRRPHFGVSLLTTFISSWCQSMVWRLPMLAY